MRRTENDEVNFVLKAMQTQRDEKKRRETENVTFSHSLVVRHTKNRIYSVLLESLHVYLCIVSSLIYEVSLGALPTIFGRVNSSYELKSLEISRQLIIIVNDIRVES